MSLTDLPARLGSYEVERELGRGGMGVVYLARDPRLDRHVAIKVLPDDIGERADRLARFEREARTLASLNHPNLAGVYGLQEHLGQQLLVLEYIPGVNLGERLRDGPAMGVEEALSVAVQVAAGLEAAHDSGIIHRDMKPANVRIRPDGVVKVLDFGLAKPEATGEGFAGADDETRTMAATEAGRILGTAGYMSPEQARGRPVDKRTDIWAFGCVLYECLTSRQAFAGETPMDAIVAVLEREPAWERLPENTPVRVIQLLHRALDKDPRRRLRDIGDARIDIEDAMTQMGRGGSPGYGRVFPGTGSPTVSRGGAIGDGPRSGTGSGNVSVIGAAGAEAMGTGGGLPSSTRYASSWPSGGTSGGAQTNVVRSLTRFVGRERELKEIAKAVRGARLVTMTGAAGCGKSRLVTEMVASRAMNARDGAWLVDLSAVTDAHVLGVEILRAFRLADVDGRSPAEIVIDALAGREVVLVLDNCDHVVGPARELVAELVGALDGLTVIVTSREALGVPGEVLYRVMPMAMPAPGLESVEMLAGNESVALFVDRAAAVKPQFELTEENAGAIAEICRRLDGIPLAIELAAARAKVLNPEQIAERLEDRFRLLRGGKKGGSSRQQTLEAAIGWSYAQLEPDEAAAFRRMCVFRGGLTLSASEAVCAGEYDGCEGEDGFEGGVVEDWEVLDLLSQLVDKSLLMVDEKATPTSGPAGEPRYMMLETIRHYGEQRLRESGEHERCRASHLEWTAKLAQKAESQLLGRHQRAWYDRFELEHDNIRAALDFVLEDGGDLELGRKIAGGAWRFWAYRGHIAEGRQYLLRLDRASAGTEPTASWAKLREGVSWISMMVGDLTTAIMFGQAGLEIARAVGERRTVANVLNCLGAACHGEGFPDRAMDYFEESLALRRDLGDQTQIAATLNNMGECHRMRGDMAAARAQYAECMRIMEGLGDVLLSALAMNNMAWADIAEGDAASAARWLRRAAAMKTALGAQTELPHCLETAGAIAVMNKKLERAARLFAAARVARQRLSSPPRPATVRDYEPWLERMRVELPEDLLRAAEADGAAMKLSRAVSYAIDGGDA